LLESELFGYEKGAFTDAKQQKKGLVELANGGTLFLDEISTLSLPLQAKLLRFLETQTFKRVGGLKDIEVDLRVIAATNQDLKQASREERFRMDLYYRLNVCPIHIPPLRNRREDILPLAKHFIHQDNLKFMKRIQELSKDAKNLFLEYSWPGNVRELKNAVERAMIFEKSSQISREHLPISLQEKPSVPRVTDRSFSMDESVPLAEMEKGLLIKALIKARGNKSKAAEILGISRDTLRYRIKKWDIKPQDTKPSDG
ncbi:MAG: sigma 54-interacting transcriptional regulator, partial [Candidatus Aminicenantes bacterium]|nr:sigma 54-interacting transcriptional regulator [Candidatus Aminicenantes bacterium]